MLTSIAPETRPASPAGLWREGHTPGVGVAQSTPSSQWTGLGSEQAPRATSGDGCGGPAAGKLPLLEPALRRLVVRATLGHDRGWGLGDVALQPLGGEAQEDLATAPH